MFLCRYQTAWGSRKLHQPDVSLGVSSVTYHQSTLHRGSPHFGKLCLALQSTCFFMQNPREPHLALPVQSSYYVSTDPEPSEFAKTTQCQDLTQIPTLLISRPHCFLCEHIPYSTSIKWITIDFIIS